MTRANSFYSLLESSITILALITFKLCVTMSIFSVSTFFNYIYLKNTFFNYPKEAVVYSTVIASDSGYQEELST